MREIKFRAWNDRENVIVPFEQIAIQVTGLKIDEGQSQNILMVDFFGSFGKGVVLMQYTGLKDKNGKEIYQGDIVLFEDTESEYVDVGIGGGGVKVAETTINNFFPVIYSNGMFGMEIEGSETFEDGFTTLHEVVETQTFTEVIGNIYENPDLISSHV